MRKVIRLSESELTKLIKRVIREQETEMGIEDVLNNPRIEKVAKNVVDQMSPKDLENLKNAFSLLGVSPTSSFGEVKNAVENLPKDTNGSVELDEDEEISQKKKTWSKVKTALFFLGIGNAGLFFAPFSMLFDKLLELDPSNQGSMEWSGILSALLIIIGGQDIFNSGKKRENE